jgi:transcriptional repressor NrdR
VDCLDCQASTRVIETRAAGDGTAVRRRRVCSSCGRRFTTYERYERAPVAIRKRNGERQPFDRAKLLGGLLRASHKRPVDRRRLEALADRIEREVERAGGELPAQRVGDMALAGLRDLDRVSYLQFAAVYKSFSDPSEFSSELARLRGSAGTDSVRFAGEDLGSAPYAMTKRGADG